jgi:hypothetical protein
MSDVPASLLRQLLAAERSRPLGDAQLVSGWTLQPFSQALRTGADNLLAKAAVALEEGDEERAWRYATRAAALQYDEHEEVHPAVWSASMALFEAVVDGLEESDDGDSSWLTAALAVLEQAEGAGAVWLRHVLGTVARDFVLEPTEAKLVRRAVGQTGGDEPDFGLTRHSSSAAVGDVVLSILRVTLAYHVARYH